MGQLGPVDPVAYTRLPAWRMRASKRWTPKPSSSVARLRPPTASGTLWFDGGNNLMDVIFAAGWATSARGCFDVMALNDYKRGQAPAIAGCARM